MKAEVDFVPKVLIVSCSNGSVQVQYGVKLTTDTIDDEVAGGQVDLSSEEITEAVNNLTVLVLNQLREQVGLDTDDSPLWDAPHVSEEDEDPL